MTVEHKRDAILGLPRRWWAREINKPWIEDDKVKISMRAETTEVDQPTNTYFPPSLLNSALEKIYDYYGRTVDAAQVSNGNIIHDEVHFYSRPLVRPVVLMSIEKSTVESALRRSTAEMEHTNPPSQLGEYSTISLLRKIKALKPKFVKYQKQYQFFDGKTKPQINFIQEYNRLEQAYARIVELVEFNGYQFRTDEDDTLRINFDENYDILDIVLVQDGMCRRLIKGNIFFLDDTLGLKDRETNQILFNLNYLYSNRNNLRDDIWSAFVENFLDQVEIDFFGRPCTNKASEILKNEIEETNRLFQSKEKLDEEEFRLASPAVQQDLINSALQEKTEDLSKKLSKVAEKIREANDRINIVKNFINKYGINHLIEAALECLALKTGADLSGLPQNIPNLPPLPGMNPYDLAKPGIVIKIPPMSFKLPTVDIFKGITEEIKEGLKAAALEAIVAMMQSLAETIMELCQGSEEEPGQGLSIPSILNQFPNAVKAGEGETPAQGMEGCYEEYDISPMLGNAFLTAVSAHLTPRETCDLLNGAPAQYVLEIIRNLIELPGGGLTSLQATFETDTEIVSFFVCLAGLMSPEYCARVYDTPRINVNDLDPCTIEDLLLEQDNDLFEDLIDAYNGLADKIDDLVNQRPDMSCGGGIVPALSEIPAFAHSIKGVMNNLFEVPKTTFTSDIEGLKAIMLKPTPGAHNERQAALLEEIQKSQERFDGNGNPVTPPEIDDRGAQFLQNIFPSSIMNNPVVQNVQSVVNTVAENEISRLQGSVSYDVSPAYKNAMATLDRSVQTPFPGAGAYVSPETVDLTDLSDMYFTLTDSTSTPSQTIYFAPGALPDGSTLLTSSAGTLTSLVAGHQEAREGLEDAFAPVLLANYVHQLTQYMNPDYSSYGFVSDAVKKQLYVPGYLSLINSLAYNIRNSELFDVTKFKNLILTPVSCGEVPGGMVGKDLFDIQNIIDEALREFAENSCSERTCIIGPVEDAIMFAATNAYIQVLLLEQLLKNIFVMDAYGVSDFMATPLVMDRIINEIYESIGTSQAAGQAILTFDMLKDVSVFYVEKQRTRIDQESPLLDPSEGPSRRVPDPLDPSGDYIEIPADIAIPTPQEIHDAATGDPGIQATGGLIADYRKYALEYMIKRRLINTAETVKSVFTNTEPNFNMSLIHNGFPVSDAIVGGKFGGDTSTGNWKADLRGYALPGFENVRVYQHRTWEPAPDSSPLRYDYGWGTGTASFQAPSNDEALFALNHGLFSRERYVKFTLDWNALAGLQEGDTAQQAAYDLIRPPLRNILPRNAHDTGPAEAVGYEYKPYPVTLTTSPAQFNNFINDLRNADAAALHAELFRLVGLRDLTGDVDDLGIEVTYIINRAPAGVDTTEGGIAVKGPLTSRNYDAIRFWINECQNAWINEEDDYANWPESVTSTYSSEEKTWSWPGGRFEAGRSYAYTIGHLSPRSPTVGWYFGNSPDHTTWLGDNYPNTFYPELNGRYDDLRDRIAIKQFHGNIDTTVGPNGAILYRLRRSDLFKNSWNMSWWWGVPLSHIEGDYYRYPPTEEQAAAGEQGSLMSDYDADQKRRAADLDYSTETTGLDGLFDGKAGVKAIFLSLPDFAERTKEIPLSEFSETSTTFQDVMESLGPDADLQDLAESGMVQYEPASNLDWYPHPPEPTLDDGEAAYSIETRTLLATGLEYGDLVLNNVISNIRIGNRIVYQSPEMETVNSYVPQMLGTSGLPSWLNGGTLQEQDNQFFENRANFLIENDGKYILHVDTGIKAETKVGEKVGDFIFNRTLAVGGHQSLGNHALLDPNRYDVLTKLFALIENPALDPSATNLATGDIYSRGAGTRLAINDESLTTQISQKPEFVTLFNDIYDTKSIVAFLFLYGLMVNEGSSRQLNSLFSDTKAAVRIILRAALAGADYTFKDSEAKSPSDMARDSLLSLAEAGLTPFAEMGASFILKMLIETPIRILKGLAEMVDPHVAIGKTIRDVSGQVIDQVGPIWDMATDAASTGTGLAEQAGAEVPPEVGEILDMSLDEFIDAGCREAFGDLPELLQPSCDPKGLNLIGKVPWLFLPPGPLGIAYILFNLLEEGFGLATPEQEQQLKDQCAALLLEVQAQQQSAEAETEAERPSSTIDCQPPPEESGCLDE